MSRKKKDPLRPLTEEERDWLERISRSQAEASQSCSESQTDFGGSGWIQLYRSG